MFSHTFGRAATFLIALASLAACDAPPLAPHAASSAGLASVTATASASAISREAATVPFSFVVYASCANGGQGEVLQANGTLEYTGHWITTSGGRREHTAIVSSFTGTATGWDTGDVYDVSQREMSQSNIDYGTDGIADSGEQRQRIAVRLTNRASRAVFDITLVGRFVQTPTGEFVQDGWQGTARCS